MLIDGQLFSPLLPEELRDLPVPPRGASEEEKLAYEAKFNLRARWRLTRHAMLTGPRGGSARSARGCCGAGRFRRPCGGPGPAPLVETEAECCCSGILRAMPVELPW